MLIDAVTAMGGDGMPLMLRVLGNATPEIWEHYPADDAVDPLTACRWFYHTHAPGERDPEEHGHFHLFLHRSVLPADARPSASPARPDLARADLVHIAGLSIDMAGLPRAWFVTNRWVTDEILFPANLVRAALTHFDVRQSCRDRAVGEFLTAMVALHRRELALMLEQRDRRLLRIGSRLRYEKGNPVLASRVIDLDRALLRASA